jgi:DNA-binding LacI/PurR family transcriptional regulator
LRTAGIVPNEKLTIRASEDDRDAVEAMRAFLAKRIPFDGLVANIDILALHAMRELKATGLRVPDDVAVIGCGNLDSGSWCAPALSTIEQYPEELGRMAVRLLREAKGATPSGKKAKPVILPSKLIERESSARRPRK